MIIVLPLCSAAVGQTPFSYYALPDSAARVPLGAIKFAPLSLFDPYNTVQASFEYLPRKKGVWGAQVEVGYGNYALNMHRTSGGVVRRDKETWRIRSEVRLYINGYIARPLHVYVAAEYFYKRSNWQNEGSVGRECENGVCAYFESITYRMHKDVLGLHAKIGMQETMGKRFLIDFYGGFGYRYVWVHSNQIGVNDFIGENRFGINIDPGYPGRYRLISAALGFKVGYLLYRKK